ncbi:glycoside hydrolase family 3 protein [Paenibacillus dakarensis]|uniref:glycoside hydrolase family 3 protein n=1 Tax=Paenibacillus dakarensis TaxID=1527293 RepID=UPI0006D57432|nr:glycoside hydrolase family 3 protein [Paenibacillus dakarensis]
MNRYTYLLLLVCILLVGLTGCGTGSDRPTEEALKPAPAETTPAQEAEQQTDEKEPDTDTVNPEQEDKALAMLNGLSLEEKVGQLVIVGIEGTTMDHFSSKLLDTYHVGGFIFFKDNLKNVDQSVKMFNSLKKANENNPVPLWMSIDEEGGRVSRMPDPILRLPASGIVGKQNDPLVAQEAGSLIGRRLKGFGLNMAFAPVLDVNSNPDNPVIGDRSYGSSPELVGRLGAAAMKGIQDTGVVSAVKHFPGHGDTSVDSHVHLPVVSNSMSRLNQIELVPFKRAIDEGAEVVMVAHLLVSSIDPDTPSSYSEPVISGLLRDKLGYDGVVITDDMVMGAVDNGVINIGEAAVRSILAGTNIVLVGHDYSKEEAVITSLLKAVKSNRISEEVLNDRVLTTLRLKLKYGLNDNPAAGPDVKQLNHDAQQLINRLKQ